MTQLTAGFPLESKEKCEKKFFSIEEILKFYQKGGKIISENKNVSTWQV